jgi:hypothetical protein
VVNHPIAKLLDVLITYLMVLMVHQGRWSMAALCLASVLSNIERRIDRLKPTAAPPEAPEKRPQGALASQPDGSVMFTVNGIAHRWRRPTYEQYSGWTARLLDKHRTEANEDFLAVLYTGTPSELERLYDRFPAIVTIVLNEIVETLHAEVHSPTTVAQTGSLN